jgi:hypothetical protein
LARADAACEAAYVETDTIRDVKFYRRHGFEVTATGDPVGVQMWYIGPPAALDSEPIGQRPRTMTGGLARKLR